MRNKGIKFRFGDTINGHRQSGQAGKSPPVFLPQLHDSIQGSHRSRYFDAGYHGSDVAISMAQQQLITAKKVKFRLPTSPIRPNLLTS